MKKIKIPTEIYRNLKLYNTAHTLSISIQYMLHSKACETRGNREMYKK